MKARYIYQVLDGEQIVMEVDINEVAKQLQVQKSVVYNKYIMDKPIKGFRLERIKKTSDNSKSKDKIPESKWREWDEMCARFRTNGKL